ncbi:MAG: Holliday junction branch migration protein RuvA [Planctomycetia bacterium]
MYEYLDGTHVQKSGTRLVVEVHGVGYELSTPLGARYEPKSRVWTHLVVREDAHLLYGFPDRDSRDLFRLLLTVRGVGPASALAVLSGLARDELLDAVVRADHATLMKVKGIGRKTAEQIVLDLRDKAAKARGSGAPGTAAGATAPMAQADEDAMAALASIGYAEKEARKAVEKARTALGPAAGLEELLRSALASS